MKQQPILKNKQRGIVVAYSKELRKFVLDPTIKSSICVGSPGSGKTQTIVLPTIEQVSRKPDPSLDYLFKAMDMPLPKTKENKIDFEKLNENFLKKNYLEYEVLKDAIYCQQSLIVNDAKGELLANSYDFLVERGYQIRVINLEKPSLSHRYNPLSVIRDQFLEAKAENPVKPNWSDTMNLVQQLANTLHDDPNSKNQHFINSAKGLTAGMILGMIEYLFNQNDSTTTFSQTFNLYWSNFLEEYGLSENEITFADAFTPYTLFNLFVNFSQKKETQTMYDMRTKQEVEVPTGRTYLDIFFDELPAFHPAKNSAMSYLSAKGEEKGSVISTTANGLSIFADTSIADMTSYHEFDFGELTVKPTAYFIVVPDDDRSRWKLSTIFVEQCFKHLSKLAKNKYGGELPRRINFLLDEFAQMPPLIDLDMKTSMTRSRNIRWLLFIQSLAQLKIKYPQYFDRVLTDNCPRLIYIKSNDSETLDHVLKELGKRTVVQRTINQERGSFKQNIGYSLVEEPLMHRDELRELKFEQGIVITSGEKPIRANYLAAFRYFHYKNEKGEWVQGIRETRLDEIPLERVERQFELEHVLGIADTTLWYECWIKKNHEKDHSTNALPIYTSNEIEEEANQRHEAIEEYDDESSNTTVF